MSALTETLTLRVTPELRAALERRAEQEQRKPSDLHRILLAFALREETARTARDRRV